MKNRVRLTESQLHRVIKESVKNVLKEGFGDNFNYKTVSRYLKSIGFQNISDYPVKEYINWDAPMNFEKKIWDDEGQIIVCADLYFKQDGTTNLGCVDAYFAHGDYSIDPYDSESGDEGFGIDDMASLKEYLKKYDLIRWD